MQCALFPLTISQWLKCDYDPARGYLLKYLNFLFFVTESFFFKIYEDGNDQILFVFFIVNSGVSFYVCS